MRTKTPQFSFSPGPLSAIPKTKMALVAPSMVQAELTQRLGLQRFKRQSPLTPTAITAVVFLAVFGIGCDGIDPQNACQELSQERMRKTCEAHASDHALCKGSAVYSMRLQELTDECKASQSSDPPR